MDTSDNISQDDDIQKFDWRDFATQAPGNTEEHERGEAAPRERSTWSKIKGGILLAHATIALILFIWLLNSSGWGTLGVLVLLIINAIVTIAALAIGAVINITVKTAKDSIVAAQNQEVDGGAEPKAEEDASSEQSEQVSVLERKNQEGDNHSNAIMSASAASALLLIISIITVFIFPIIAGWGNDWYQMGIAYRILVTALGVTLLIQSIVSLCIHNGAAKKVLIAPMPGAFVTICLNFVFLIPENTRKMLIMLLLCAYALIAFIITTYAKYRTNDRLVEMNGKGIAIASIFFSIISLLIYYLFV